MSDLREFQQAFVAALLGPPEQARDSPFFAQPGFAVHRNTVMAGSIAALADNYPTVRRLVGDEWFHEAAGLFVRESLPRDGALARYGQGLAAFLGSFPPAAEMPYLPGVAALDRCWTEAHLADDAPVLSAGDLAAFDGASVAHARLVLHPAARWQAFAAMPVYTVWRRHRERLPLDEPLPWRGENALLTRPGGAVRWIEIADEAAAFLAACASGRAFADALDDATSDAASAPPAAWLPALVQAGAFTQLAMAKSPQEDG